MRLGCLPWIFAVALVWGGGQSAYTGFTNLKQTEISVEELYQNIPSAKWLKVTGGQLNVLDAAYTSFLGADPSSLYIPVLPPLGGDSEGEGPSQIRLLLHTKNASYLEQLKKLKSLAEDENTDEAAVIQALASMHDQLFPVEDIDGIVLFGIEDGKSERKVRELFDNLHPECLVLEEGEKPSMVMGLVLLAAGIALTLFLGLGSKTKKVAPLGGGQQPPPIPPGQQPPPLNQ